MGGVVAVFYHGSRVALGTSVATCAAILAGAAVYVVLLFATHAIEGEELRHLPRGDKIYLLYRKFRPARRKKHR
jgi:hypothetical protein